MRTLLNYSSRMEAFVAFLTFWRRAFIGFFIVLVLAGIGNHFFPFFGAGVFDAVLVTGIVTWVVGGLLGIFLGARLCRDEEKRVRATVDHFVDRLAPVADRHAREINDIIDQDHARLDGLTAYQKGVVISRVFQRIGDGK